MNTITNKIRVSVIGAILGIVCTVPVAMGSDLTVTKTWSSGETLTAQDLNDSFDEVEIAVTDNNIRITNLEADSSGWVIFGSDMYTSILGNVGIGTTSPSQAKLHVFGGDRGVYGVATAGTNTVRPFGIVADIETGAATTTGGGFQTAINTNDTPNVGFVYGGQFSIDDDGDKIVRGLNINLNGAESDDIGLEVIVDDPGYAIQSPGSGKVYLNGNVGIGTASPLWEFEVHWDAASNINPIGLFKTTGANSAAALRFENANNNHFNLGITSSGEFAIGEYNKNISLSGDFLRITNTGNVGIGTTDPGSYKLYVAGNAFTTGAWVSSDARWKKNVEPLENSLNKVTQLQGVHYEWNIEQYPEKGFDEGRQVGLIAQEVEKVIPELVRTNEDGYKSLSYEKLSVVLIEAVKELKAENEALKILVCQEHHEAALCSR